MICDLVGNGPSSGEYVPFGAYTLMCNIPLLTRPWDGTVIVDRRPVTWMKNNSYTPTKPVYTTQTVKDYAKKNNIQGDWFVIGEHKERISAGVLGAEYLCRFATQIHMWGFDSLWSTDVSSKTDAIIPRARRPRLEQWWRPQWQQLFDANPSVEFHIYLPQGASVDVKNANVKQHHQKNQTVVE